MNEQTHDHSRDVEYMERILARGFVIAGGLFWVFAAFMGPYAYEGISLSGAARMAAWPLAAALMTLIIGWRYERLASVLLFAASAGVVVWGALYAWEPGLWILMALVLIAPMMLSAALFTLAARSEESFAPSVEEADHLPARGMENPTITRAHTP